MRLNRLTLYVHVTWATRDRLPLITPEIERPLYRNIKSTVSAMGYTTLAVSAMPEHVHLLVKASDTIMVSQLAKQVRENSARFCNETLPPGAGFAWQDHYDAFFVDRRNLRRVVGYIRRQKSRHAAGDLWPEWEQTGEEASARGGDDD